MYSGVIFDFNGTLFWDTHLHNEAWDIFLKQYNINLTAEEKHLKLHGKNNAQLISELFDVVLSDDEIYDIAHKKELIYQDLVKRDGLQLAEGVIELLESLNRAGIVYTIVTASDQFNVDFFWEYLELDRWFKPELIVFADGSTKPKPFPDMFIKAMKILGIKPVETLIFEDSETGLTAAQHANPGKIIIVNSNNSDYSSWNYEIIKTFAGINVNKLIS